MTTQDDMNRFFGKLAVNIKPVEGVTVMLRGVLIIVGGHLPAMRVTIRMEETVISGREQPTIRKITSTFW